MAACINSKLAHMDRYCECGCGQETWIATVNNAGLGYVAGQPVRFVRGHNGRKSPGLSYSAAHKYLSRHFAKTGICEECGSQDKTDYALTRGRQYSHDREDYRELCHSCHMEYDLGGDRNSNAKLTVAAVRDIREKYAEDSSYGTLTRLARTYDVTLSTVSRVAHGKTWKGVT